MLRCRDAEHKGVYYTTVSEPHTKLVRHLEPFTFFDARSLGSRVEYIHLGDFLRPGRPDGLGPMVSEIERKTLEDEPAVVVIDSAKMLRDFFGERELRSAFYDLTASFAETGTVLLMVGEYPPEELGSGIEFSLADGIIQLEYQLREPVDRRTLRVVKMRGASHVPGRHTFQIGPGGIEVFPRIETLIPARVRHCTARSQRDPRPGRSDARRAEARRCHARHGAFGRRQDHLGDGLDRAGPKRRRTLPVRHVPGHRRPSHWMAAAFGWKLAAARDSGHLVIFTFRWATSTWTSWRTT